MPDRGLVADVFATPKEGLLPTKVVGTKAADNANDPRATMEAAENFIFKTQEGTESGALFRCLTL